MGIKEERNDARNVLRSEYIRLHSKVDREVNRRISTGYTRLRALAEVTLELKDGNYTVVCSPPPPGSNEFRIPSVETINIIIQDLYNQALPLRNETHRASVSSRPPELFNQPLAIRLGASRPSNSSSAPISPILSPGQRRSNPPREVSMGNAVRNLGSAFGLRSPDYRRDERESHNRRSWREESADNLRMMADVAATRKRNAVERVRAANHLPPMVDGDIPRYQYNPHTFKPRELTLKQTASVMSTFDFYDHHATIRNTFLQFSIKIRGMEPATGEALHAAVLSLIKKYFKFQPVILLCMRPVEDPDDSSAVGVLFERTESAFRIFNNRRVLANTRYSVVRNLSMGWIIWNYKD